MSLTKTYWTSTLSTALVSALALGAVGCDEAPSEAPELSLVNGTHIAVTRAADDAAPAVRERKAKLSPAKATTQPWEPGSGYYQQVDEDVYYDTCAPGHSGPAGIVSVTEVEVDPVTKTLTTYTVYLEIPEGIDLNNEDGPIQVGDRIPDMEGCEYTGLYAKCPGQEVVVDLSFFLPHLDARIVLKSEGAHQFWNYGHDGFRVLTSQTQTCEGEDCDDPIVAAIVGGESVNCASMSMIEFDRVPDPNL